MTEQDNGTMTDEEIQAQLQTDNDEPESNSEFRTRMQSALDEVRAEKSILARKVQAFEAAEAEKKRKQLIEEGDIKELLKQEKEQRQALQAELSEAKATRLRVKIGAEEGLPLELCLNLRGTAEEVIRDNAQRMMQAIKGMNQSSGRADGSRRTGQPRKRLNEVQLREQSRSKTTVTKM